MKTKSINHLKNPSFLELDWKIGEVMGFDNSDLDMAQPFMLAVPKSITRGFDRSGLRLSYGKEEYTLHPKGDMLALDAAFRDKVRFDILKRGLPHANPYSIDKAYSGKDAVRNALNAQVGFSHYAYLIYNNELVVERGPVGSVFERMCLGFLLPNQLRMRGYEPLRVIGGR